MKEIYHCLYVSFEIVPFFASDLQKLLVTAQRHNKDMGVTGLLLKRENVFLQLLEGPRPAVQQIFEKIKKDQRHSAIEIIAEAVSDTRLFPKWSMGNIADTELDERIPELIPFLKSLAKRETGKRSAIFKILKEFSSREMLHDHSGSNP